jgi:hypothetical protein
LNANLLFVKGQIAFMAFRVICLEKA